jgi:hypothetical protein
VTTEIKFLFSVFPLLTVVFFTIDNKDSWSEYSAFLLRRPKRILLRQKMYSTFPYKYS